MGLFGESMMTQSMKMLEKGLDTTSLRQKVIANNIANVDVPHFKRSEVSFESELKRVLDFNRQRMEEPPLLTADPKHISTRPHRKPKNVAPNIHTDYHSTMRNDGNNVDIEDETSKLVRNQLRYHLMIDRLASSFRHLNFLLRPGV